MSPPSRGATLVAIGAILAAASVLILPILFGPLAMLAAGAAIWVGARRPGTVLLFASAAAMALGMYLGCRVACK